MIITVGVRNIVVESTCHPLSVTIWKSFFDPLQQIGKAIESDIKAKVNLEAVAKNSSANNFEFQLIGEVMHEMRVTLLRWSLAHNLFH